MVEVSAGKSIPPEILDPGTFLALPESVLNRPTALRTLADRLVRAMRGPTGTFTPGSLDGRESRSIVAARFAEIDKADKEIVLQRRRAATFVARGPGIVVSPQGQSTSKRFSTALSSLVGFESANQEFADNARLRQTPVLGSEDGGRSDSTRDLRKAEPLPEEELRSPAARAFIEARNSFEKQVAQEAREREARMRNEVAGLTLLSDIAKGTGFLDAKNRSPQKLDGVVRANAGATTTMVLNAIFFRTAR